MSSIDYRYYERILYRYTYVRRRRKIFQNPRLRRGKYCTGVIEYYLRRRFRLRASRNKNVYRECNNRRALHIFRSRKINRRILAPCDLVPVSRMYVTCARQYTRRHIMLCKLNTVVFYYFYVYIRTPIVPPFCTLLYRGR